MLETIFSWILDAMGSTIAMLIVTLINILDLSMDKFVSVFPFFKHAYSIFQAIAVGIVLMILIFAVIKFLLPGNERNRETPGSILLRSIFSGIFIFMGGHLVFWFVDLAKDPYTAFKLMINQDIMNDGESGPLAFFTHSLQMVTTNWTVVDSVKPASAAYIFLAAILIILIGWNILKLALEVVERYLMVGVLAFTSPLAFSTMASADAFTIFRKWVSMFVSQLILMFLSVFSFGLILSAFSFLGASADGSTPFWVRLIMILAMLKIAQRLDSYMQQLGLNAGTTGQNLLDDIIATTSAIPKAIRTGRDAYRAGSKFLGALGAKTVHGSKTGGGGAQPWKDLQSNGKALPGGNGGSGAAASGPIPPSGGAFSRAASAASSKAAEVMENLKNSSVGRAFSGAVDAAKERAAAAAAAGSSVLNTMAGKNAGMSPDDLSAKNTNDAVNAMKQVEQKKGAPLGVQTDAAGNAKGAIPMAGAIAMPGKTADGTAASGELAEGKEQLAEYGAYTEADGPGAIMPVNPDDISAQNAEGADIAGLDPNGMVQDDAEGMLADDMAMDDNGAVMQLDDNAKMQGLDLAQDEEGRAFVDGPSESLAAFTANNYKGGLQPTQEHNDAAGELMGRTALNMNPATAEQTLFKSGQDLYPNIADRSTGTFDKASREQSDKIGSPLLQKTFGGNQAAGIDSALPADFNPENGGFKNVSSVQARDADGNLAGYSARATYLASDENGNLIKDRNGNPVVKGVEYIDQDRFNNLSPSMQKGYTPVQSSTGETYFTKGIPASQAKMGDSYRQSMGLSGSDLQNGEMASYAPSAARQTAGGGTAVATGVAGAAGAIAGTQAAQGGGVQPHIQTTGQSAEVGTMQEIAGQGSSPAAGGATTQFDPGQSGTPQMPGGQAGQPTATSAPGSYEAPGQGSAPAVQQRADGPVQIGRMDVDAPAEAGRGSGASAAAAAAAGGYAAGQVAKQSAPGESSTPSGGQTGQRPAPDSYDGPNNAPTSQGAGRRSAGEGSSGYSQPQQGGSQGGRRRGAQSSTPSAPASQPTSAPQPTTTQVGNGGSNHQSAAPAPNSQIPEAAVTTGLIGATAYGAGRQSATTEAPPVRGEGPRDNGYSNNQQSGSRRNDSGSSRRDDYSSSGKQEEPRRDNSGGDGRRSSSRGRDDSGSYDSRYDDSQTSNRSSSQRRNQRETILNGECVDNESSLPKKKSNRRETSDDGSLGDYLRRKEARRRFDEETQNALRSTGETDTTAHLNEEGFDE